MKLLEMEKRTWAEVQPTLTSLLCIRPTAHTTHHFHSSFALAPSYVHRFMLVGTEYRVPALSLHSDEYVERTVSVEPAHGPISYTAPPSQIVFSSGASAARLMSRMLG